MQNEEINLEITAPMFFADKNAQTIRVWCSLFSLDLEEKKTVPLDVGEFLQRLAE